MLEAAAARGGSGAAAPPIEFISATELAARLERGDELAVCDVRSSRLFAQGHVRGAFSLACSSLQARRLCRGKGRLRDLVPAARKQRFSSLMHEGATVVVYDDRSSSVAQHATNPLHVFCGLLSEATHGRVVVLRGGYARFASAAPGLCDRPDSCPTGSLSLQLPIGAGGACAETPQVTSGGKVMDAPPTVVCPHLLLGSQRDAEDPHVLERFGVRAVLNVTPDTPERHHAPGVSYKQLPILDTWHQSISDFFDETFAFIDEHRGKDGGSVLVHCSAGISRSPTIVIAYLMRKNRWSLDSAYASVRRRRPIISPNLDFMGHLHYHERVLSSTESDSSSSSVSPVTPLGDSDDFADETDLGVELRCV